MPEFLEALSLGDVVVSNQHIGVLRYLGPISNDEAHISEIYAGLELCEATGNNDGSLTLQTSTTVKTIRYFHCVQPNHGVMIKATDISKKVTPMELLTKVTVLNSERQSYAEEIMVLHRQLQELRTEIEDSKLKEQQQQQQQQQQWQNQSTYSLSTTTTQQQSNYNQLSPQPQSRSQTPPQTTDTQQQTHKVHTIPQRVSKPNISPTPIDSKSEKMTLSVSPIYVHNQTLPRCVFLSMFQLNNKLHKIPNEILKNCLCCFKMNRNTLLNYCYQTASVSTIPSNNSNNNSTNFMSHFSLNDQFKQFIIEKDLQKCMLWFPENHEPNNGIASWHHISQQLTQISDPWQQEIAVYYQGLKLNINRGWESYNDHSYYNVSLTHIIEEITNCNLKYLPTMEIMRQSNPSLYPITRWDSQTMGEIQSFMQTINSLKQGELP